LQVQAAAGAGSAHGSAALGKRRRRVFASDVAFLYREGDSQLAVGGVSEAPRLALGVPERLGEQLVDRRRRVTDAVARV
jgi:hypothetical protein